MCLRRILPLPERVGCACAILLLWCGGAVAQPPAGAPAGDAPPETINAFTACREPARRHEILVAKASRRLHQTVCGASLWFDGLFGERDLDAAQHSHGRVEIGAAYSEFSGSRTRVRFHAALQLPALERRLSAFIGRDDEDSFVRDRTEGQALRSFQRPSDRDEFLAGFGFAAVTSDRYQSDFKIGAGNLRRPKVFVQNRFSYIPYSQEETRILLRLTPFWNNRDGLGVTTSHSFDHALAEAFVARWAIAATVSESTAGLDWRNAVLLYQNLRGSRAAAYEAFVRGATRAAEPLGEYGVRTVWREPFYGERLFLEFVLGYSWPRDDPALPREGAVDLGVGVEMPFGLAPPGHP